MKLIADNQQLDRVFQITLIIKAIDSVLEIIGGLFILIISPSSLNALIRLLTQHELSQDPHDFIATHLLHAGQTWSQGSHWFAALYLLSHGIIKIIIIIALLRRQLWAYPAMVVILGIFIMYQVYRLVQLPTLGLLLITLFDGFMIWLTWREYNWLRAKTT